MALFNIPIRDIFAGFKSQEDPDRDAAGIPFTAKEHIRALKKEYEERTLAANDPGMESCFNYCWALVHSRAKGRDVDMGLDFVQALLSHPESTSEMVSRRELLYLKAVGEYRKKEYLRARETLQGLLKVNPDFRQAESLLEHVENELVKEGLIGIGAGAAILGVVGAIAVASMSHGKSGKR
ncbi:hypothetical protein M9435_003249 [Picochlorum sp. BPE23]|nr:hypothetical protein M9435_003249 [Picochlorum sp. BPE23]